MIGEKPLGIGLPGIITEAVVEIEVETDMFRRILSLPHVLIEVRVLVEKRSGEIVRI
jgi:hypothetical protein